MNKKPELALLYIRNGVETIFPVQDIEQAMKLADAIAESDLLNGFVDYNMFDVYEYDDGGIDDAWMSEDYEDFNEYWEAHRAINK